MQLVASNATGRYVTPSRGTPLLQSMNRATILQLPQCILLHILCSTDTVVVALHGACLCACVMAAGIVNLSRLLASVQMTSTLKHA